MKYKTKEFTQLDETIAEDTSDRGAVQEELDAALATMEQDVKYKTKESTQLDEIIAEDTLDRALSTPHPNRSNASG